VWWVKSSAAWLSSKVFLKFLLGRRCVRVHRQVRTPWLSRFPPSFKVSGSVFLGGGDHLLGRRYRIGCIFPPVRCYDFCRCTSRKTIGESSLILGRNRCWCFFFLKVLYPSVQFDFFVRAWNPPPPGGFFPSFFLLL